MPDRVSFKKVFTALEQAIGITQQRHGLISSNISNLDTPEYKPKDIDFRAALARSLEAENGINLMKTDKEHVGLEAVSGKDFEQFEEEDKWNGFNWVDMDKEMTRLAENNLRYRAATETLLRKIAMLKEVIKEGGR
jgi:flagellar basal-body rod protein FlgB